MYVSDIMETDLIAFGLDDAIGDIKLIFDTRGFHHVPILDEGKLVGVISDRDVLRQISPLAYTDKADLQARNTLTKKAHQIMSRNLKTIRPRTTIKAAGMAMLAGSVSCLLVTQPTGELEGIITMKDLLGFFIHH